MSTYSQMTKNPSTGVFEKALWMDDYFSPHHYGVKFPDGSIVDNAMVKLETRKQTAEERLAEVEAQLNDAFDTIRDLRGQILTLEKAHMAVKKAAGELVALGEQILARRLP